MITPLGSSPVATSASSADAGDDARVAEYGVALADAIEAALSGWVVRQVSAVAQAWDPGLEVRIRSEAVGAGTRAVAMVGPRLRELLQMDPDQQRGTPLALVRDIVRLPTQVLAAAGVGEVQRDAFAVEAFPEDVYGLSPASLADLSPAAHEAGLAWGAAKAHVILARRRDEGMR